MMDDDGAGAYGARPVARCFLLPSVVRPLLWGVVLVAACGGGRGAAPTTSPTTLPPKTAAPPGTLVVDRPALYPRVVRLAHNGDANGQLLLSYVAFPGGAYGEGEILRSTDDGHTWSRRPVGVVRDTSAYGLCCATLYEVPRATGGLAAGTLLWAASVGQDEPNRRMAIRVWASTDRGRHWRSLSSCAAAPNAGGLWEPEFSLAADGRLVCHYSDETRQPRYSQTLVRTYSADGGATWGAPVPTVASAIPAHRPGMATVRQLPSGPFVMTYEVCGLPGAANCAAHIRASADGLDWGDSGDVGARVLARDGRYFAHAPVLALAPGGRGGVNGRLLLVGQLVFTAAGSQDASAGRLLMTNAGGGFGPWDTAPAPSAVPHVYDNYCPNYSSSPLASADGARVLLVATAYDGRTCKAYSGTGALAP